MRRQLRALAALTMIAVICGGCSSGPAKTATGGNSAGGSAATVHEQAMKFSQCMRDNGVKDFPDPGPSGELTVDGVVNGTALDPNSAAWKKAIGACQNLQPEGFTGHKRSAQQQQAALKFAQCMRDNGVKDFPDPTPDSPLIDTNRIPSAETKGGMNALHAAGQKCRDYAKDAGVTADGGQQ